MKHLLWLCVVLCLCSSPALWAQQHIAPTPAYSDVTQGARILTQQHVATHDLPGLAIAVSVGDQIIWSEGFGYADVEQRVPVWPTTKFRIASISKPLTAAAIAQLYEQGKIDVDAPIQQYVPSFPEKAYPVTTRQLGGHLGGIRHYAGDEFLIRDPYPTVEAGLAIFKDDPLIHEPGSAYRYSSYGWNLISAVVQGASGEAFLHYMRRHVFLPLQMTHTVADHPDSLIYQRARPYMRNDDGVLLNAMYVDNSYKWAGGGFLSTTEDLLRFAQAHMDDDFLSEEAKTLLFTEQQTTAGEGVGYGFGWSIGEHPSGIPIYAHNGGAMGGSTRLVFEPESQVAVVILINVSGANLNIANQVMDLYMAATP